MTFVNARKQNPDCLKTILASLCKKHNGWIYYQH